MSRFRSALLLLAAVLLLAGPASAAGASPTASSPADPSPAVSELRVSVDITNTNRSQVPCDSDGEAYTVKGVLVGPAALLSQRRIPAATLYVHALGFTSYYWHFTADPEYDHVTQMARLGHVGLVHDRIGYGDEPRPDGMQSCYGSDADITAQLVTALKQGSYSVEGGAPIAVDRVAVASHSQAGLIVQPMAYSFDVADALVLTSWTDEGNRPEVFREAATTAQDCLASGVTGEPAPFYAYYPRSDEAFRSLSFHQSPEDVAAAATALRQPDPCGQGGSLAATLLADREGLAQIDVPVLLAYGAQDAYRQPEAAAAHAAKFTGSPDVTLEVLEDTGNALALESSAGEFRALLAGWLCARQLAAPAACTAAEAPAPTSPATGPPVGEPTAAPTVLGVAARSLPVTGQESSALVVALALLGAAAAGRRLRTPRGQADL